MRSLPILLALGMAACDEDPAERAYDRTTVPAPADHELGAELVTPPDDGFVYATGVTVLQAHAPTRFEARLPTQSMRFGTDGGVGDLPADYFASRLCANDEVMRTRVLEAVEKIADAGEVDFAAVDAYAAMLSRCASAEHCTWMVDVAGSDRPFVARDPFLRSLGWCASGRVGEELRRFYGVPPATVVNYYYEHVAPSGNEVPTVLEAAVRQVVDAQHTDAFSNAALALARYPGKKSAALIAELQAAADRSAAEDVDAYGYPADAPALLAHACEYLLDAPQCADLDGYREISDQDLFINGTEAQYEQALLNPKRASKANAILAACVRELQETDERRRVCFVRLAAREWTLARKLAADVSTSDSGFAESLHIVSTFESRDAFRGELGELGLVTDHVEPSWDELLSTANEMLRSRRLHVFSPRSGTVPVRHDALLFHLAGMAGTAMNDVVFEELPPSDIDDMYTTSPHVLRAYADGKRWTAVADAIDDHYELKQTIGLLNVVAAARGSDLRWAALRDDQNHAVIVAPKDGIRLAVLRGYIDLAEL